jgi:pimeloyl-ACP methyl ester carboxylesterase
MTSRTPIALLVATALLFGCAFRQLRKEVDHIEKLGELKGSVELRGLGSAPVVVVFAEEGPDGEGVAVNYRLMAKGGDFDLLVEPGEYYIGAFQDENRNFAYDPGEPTAHWGEPSPIVVAAGEVRGDLKLVLTPDRRVDLGMPMDVSAAAFRGDKNSRRHMGVVTTLDDERFTQKRGEQGLWEPYTFLLEVGAGVFFLEEYSPEKTPVLFVHGAAGFPSQFRSLIAGLDAQHYQPWVFLYPSGWDLDDVSRYLTTCLQELRTRHDYDEVLVVAHSMGGLVSRSALNRNLDQADPVEIPRFVTISTPWRGVSSAKSGVDVAPVAVPSWKDVVPDSPFLQATLARPLASDTAHLLAFGYKGRGLTIGAAGDKTVTLASQLDLGVQLGAARVVGVDEDHVSILSSAVVSQLVNEFIEEGASQ